MGCCHYILPKQNELLNLDKEIERERLRALKNEGNAHNHNSLSDFFASDTKRVLKQNPSICSNNDVKRFNSRLSYESFGHADIVPLTIASSLLNEINHLRTNPHDFAEKVERYANMIQYNNNQGWFIDVNESTILLNKSKDYFINAVEYLRSVHPMHPLKFDSDLTIRLQNHNKQDIDDVEAQIALVKESNNKYKECYVVSDKNVSNAEFVAVYNYVDLCSENFQKRNTLLSTAISNVGISCFKIDDVNRVYCYIIIFGLEKENEM